MAVLLAPNLYILHVQYAISAVNHVFKPYTLGLYQKCVDSPDIHVQQWQSPVRWYC